VPSPRLAYTPGAISTTVLAVRSESVAQFRMRASRIDETATSFGIRLSAQSLALALLTQLLSAASWLGLQSTQRIL